MTLFFIIWCAWALVSCTLAITKKRNAVIWFFIGFFLGPIGFIILAFMEKQENEITKTKSCVFCAEDIKLNAIFCRFCNKEQPQKNKFTEVAPAYEKLHKAVWGGDYSEVVELINSGVDIHQVNENGKTALMLAEERNDTLIIKLLKNSIQGT